MEKYLILFIFFLFPNGLVGQEQTMGLFYTSDEAADGFTLFSNNETTYLINNCGFVVRKWESDYKPGQGVYLMPNGDLLRAGKVPGDFNAGGRGGIFELFNWNGELKWTFRLATHKFHAHHDLAILPNGNFLCTVWEKHTSEEAKSKGRIYNGELWSEKIIEIKIIGDQEAEFVWEWSIWDHLIQDQDPFQENYGVVGQHPELLDINYFQEEESTSGNWLHFNSIAYNEEFDQILVSCRNTNEIYVIDHSTTTEQASSHQGGYHGKGGDLLYRYGNPQVYHHGTEADRKLYRQHDANWVPNNLSGSMAISVFNNGFLPGKQSAVQIFRNPINELGNYNFDPIAGFGDNSIIRQYTNENLYSDILSSVQLLPNGNMLILEGRKGHLFEVNENDEVVWKYVNPVNQNGGAGIQGAAPRFNLLYKARRYPSNFSGFGGKEMEPIAPIEFSPIEKDCGEINYVDYTFKDPSPVGNLIMNVLKIENENSFQVMSDIFSICGKKILTLSLLPGLNEVDVSNLENGVYVIKANHKDSQRTHRFVKI